MSTCTSRPIQEEGKSEPNRADFNNGKARIGTGPYKFVEWVTGDRPRPGAQRRTYWGDKPKWDKVTFKPIKSARRAWRRCWPATSTSSTSVPTADIERKAAKNDKNVTLSQGISNRVIYLHLDHDRDELALRQGQADGGAIKNPLKDARVRKAISKAINREAIVERVMEGVGHSGRPAAARGLLRRQPEPAAEPYDPEGAKALLAEAGYPDGFQLTIHGPNDRYINDAKIAEAIAQMLTRHRHQDRRSRPCRRASTSSAPRAAGRTARRSSPSSWSAGAPARARPPRRCVAAAHLRQGPGFGASNRGPLFQPRGRQAARKALATVDDTKRGRPAGQGDRDGRSATGHHPAALPGQHLGRPSKGIVYTARTDETTLAHRRRSEFERDGRAVG